MRIVTSLVILAMCACVRTKDVGSKSVIEASYGARLFASFGTGNTLQCTATPVAIVGKTVTFITAAFCVRDEASLSPAARVEIEFPKRGGGFMRLTARIVAIGESLSALEVIFPDDVIMPEIPTIAAAFPLFDESARQKPVIASRICSGDGCRSVEGNFVTSPRKGHDIAPNVAVAEALMPTPDGSAGSGVFDKNGRLVGVVWGRSEPDRKAIIVPVNQLHQLIEAR